MCGWQLLVCRKEHCLDDHDERFVFDNLYSRGPDQQIVHQGEGFRAIFTRLSIRELSGGIQPFLFENFISMANGELYNTFEIANKLKSKYPELNIPKGDMQLLGVSVSKDGAEILRMADGFYSGICIDTNLHLVTLFRDKIGEKPLVYALNNEHFIASTNPECCEPGLELMPEKIPGFLAYGFWPDRTSPFSSITRLLPAEIVRFNFDSWSVEHETYWEWPKSSSTSRVPRSNREYVNPSTLVLNQVSEAVNRQLASDVPVACLLSGGLDSTAIATLATKLLGKPIPAFTLGFPEKSFDETQVAIRSAKLLNLQHEVYTPTREEFIEAVPNVLASMKMPILDPACISLFLITKFIGNRYKVCMTGDGGDEIFRGYEIYRHSSKIELILSNEALRRCALYLVRLGIHIPTLSTLNEKSYTNLKMKLQRLVSVLENPHLNSVFVALSPFSGVKELSSILKYFPQQESVNFSIQRIDDLYRNYILPRVYAEKADRMSMANSIELRAPFLSPNLIEALNPFDSYLKSVSKWEILSPIFSEKQKRILESRPKHGFMPPIHQFIGSFDISNELLHIAGLSPRNYGKVRKRVNSGDQNASLAYWALIVMDYYLHFSSQNLQNQFLES
jgi:asparagine synthase (glutamine-hydrolysing)